MTDVHLTYINNVWMRIEAEASIIMELSDHFTFFAENYKFHPKYRTRMWDGKIRLLKTMSRILYAGLSRQVKKFCEARNYTISFDDEFYHEEVSEHELKTFIDKLNIPAKYSDRDYQFKSILKCIRSKRRVLESPTSSGKSLMIYIITRWYGQKGLIVVPTIGLVAQMASDFKEYGFKGKIHLSTDGLSKSNNIDADYVITTWQSLNNGKTKMPKQWYKQFGCVFGDECHHCKAMSLIQIMENLEDCKYRFGTTGTLDDVALNTTTIEGLFGPRFKSVNTRELMDQGYVSKLKIKCLVLNYPEHIKKDMKKKTYHDEIDFITTYENRTKFIKNLALSLKGNKLVFFRQIDHGESLYQAIKEESSHNVFYIDGSVDAKDREIIRSAIEDEHNATLVASLGTTSTGISVNKLHHMIAASPTKSKIKVLQSIGRMLRLHESKDKAYLYDIVDDLSYGSYKNHTLKHFIERTKIYDQEQFDYEIYNIGIK